MGQRREGRAAVPGGSVWYEVVGEDRGGIPLVVVHGGPGLSHDYLENLSALEEDRPVVFYDQLGSGRSDRPEDVSLWTVERFVEELACLRREVELPEVHLLGQSWGALVVAAYLAKAREGVRSVIFSGPALSAPRFAADQEVHVAALPSAVRETLQRCRSQGDYASDAYQEAMQVFYQRHVCRLDPWPEALERTLAAMNPAVYGHMWGPSEFDALGTLRNVDYTAVLPTLHVPVLYTCGEFDEAPPATVAFYCAQTPGAEMVVLEGASHVHHLEAPEKFLAAVRSFLRRAEG